MKHKAVIKQIKKDIVTNCFTGGIVSHEYIGYTVPLKEAMNSFSGTTNLLKMLVLSMNLTLSCTVVLQVEDEQSLIALNRVTINDAIVTTQLGENSPLVDYLNSIKVVNYMLTPCLNN